MSFIFVLAVLATTAPVAVERTSGRVAVVRGETVEVFGADLERREAVLPAPAGEVELLEFISGVVTYAFAMPRSGSPARAAVGVEDGIERLIWPNVGIGERFPGLTARLSADGAGLFEFLRLDDALREELGLPEDIPDGAGTVATYRFADERVWAIAAADFADAVALAPGDALVATSDGGLLRFRTGAGLLWRRPGQGKPLTMLDVEPAQGLAVVGGDGGLEVVAVDSGQRRGEWRRDGIVDARLLADGRLVAATGVGEVLLVTLTEGRPPAVSRLENLDSDSGRPPGGPCPGQARPLACVHPAPGGVIVPAGAGWHLLPLPGQGHGGQPPPRVSPAAAAPPSR
ncbi:MAG: hypothetical protein HRF46_08660 [Acidobacteriota bacterium]|jgi:hypothetical protein